MVATLIVNSPLKTHFTMFMENFNYLKKFVSGTFSTRVADSLRKLVGEFLSSYIKEVNTELLTQNRPFMLNSRIEVSGNKLIISSDPHKPEYTKYAGVMIHDVERDIDCERVIFDIVKKTMKDIFDEEMLKYFSGANIYRPTSIESSRLPENHPKSEKDVSYYICTLEMTFKDSNFTKIDP
jgi:hypothetical protein